MAIPGTSKFTAEDNETRTGHVPTLVVIQLAEVLLDCGRTIVTNNYYSSVDLENCLLRRKTHLLGTLQKKQKRKSEGHHWKEIEKGEVWQKKIQQGW